MLATLPAFAPAESAAEGADGRYPVWPTELDRIAAPLRDPASMSESARIAALGELSEFASEVILPDLELALTDPSPEVRKTALQLCAERQLLACVGAAETMWEEGEGGVRLMALELLSRQPTAEHLELLREAMDDPSDLMREQALILLAEAPLDEAQSQQAREEIIKHLSDISARVRRTAARSLGQLGPGEGALALVRLLEDLDRNVANAAAIALGQIGDARVAPALQRSLESPTDSNFAASVVYALGQLPGDDVEAFLLELFDTPPRNLRRADVSKAMGRRPNPGARLVSGLVERMRDQELRPEAINALLWLGDAALSALEDASARGLEPNIALEVERLLAARRVELTPRVALREGPSERTVVLPSADEREAWFELMGDPEAIEVGAALGELAPPWLEGALAWQIERGAAATQVRPYLAALAVAEQPLLAQKDHLISWARIATWAHEPGASTESRCLATLALMRADGTSHAEFALAELRALAAAHIADVRGCAAIGLARLGDQELLEQLLADPSPRVRASAAIAVGMLRRPSSQLRARLAVQADHDSEMRARTGAAAVLEGRTRDLALSFVRGPSGSAAGSTVISHWTRFELGGRELDVPMLGGGRGWAIVPLEGATAAPIEASPIPTQPYRYNYFDYYHM